MSYIVTAVAAPPLGRNDLDHGTKDEGEEPRSSPHAAGGQVAAPRARARPAPAAPPTQAPLLLLLAGGVAALGTWLLAGRRKHRRPARATKGQLFSVLLRMEPPEGAPAAQQPLAGAAFVVSDRFDVQGVETRFSCDAWRTAHCPAAVSAAAVDALVTRGATGVGIVPGECLGLG